MSDVTKMMYEFGQDDFKKEDIESLDDLTQLDNTEIMEYGVQISEMMVEALEKQPYIEKNCSHRDRTICKGFIKTYEVILERITEEIEKRDLNRKIKNQGGLQ